MKRLIGIIIIVVFLVGICVLEEVLINSTLKNVENMGKNGLKDGFKFIPMESNPNVGKVIVKPNYDTSDENYFPFLSVDGYHRLLSYFKGYKK